MNFRKDNGNIKIIIAVVIVVLIIIISMIMIKSLEKKPVEPIKKEPYEYFTLTSLDGKVGVIDKLGKKIIEPKYTTIYIPNQSKDIFICFEDESNYIILNSKGKDMFTEYNSVYPITISDTTLEMEKKY